MTLIKSTLSPRPHNVVALEFILKDDTELRSAAYFLEHHFQEKDRAEEFLGKDSPLKDAISEEELEKAKASWKRKAIALENLVSKNSLFAQVNANRQATLEGRRNKKYNCKPSSMSTGYQKSPHFCRDLI